MNPKIIYLFIFCCSALPAWTQIEDVLTNLGFPYGLAFHGSTLYISDDATGEILRTDVSAANLGGRWTDSAHAAIAAYQSVADKHGLDITQMSLAWCLTRPFMTSVIFGATSMAQLETAVKSADLEVGPEVMDDILSVYKQFPAPY